MDNQIDFDIRDRIDFDRVVERTRDELLTEARQGSLLAFEYASYREMEEPDRYEPKGPTGFDEDFLGFAHMHAVHMVMQAIDQLMDVVEPDGWLVAHRAMVVVPEWFDIYPNERALGLCW